MIPGIDRNTQLILLWGLAILVLGWTWLPALIAALGGSRFTQGISNEAAGKDLSSPDRDDALWANQLQALGYELIGSGWQRINFASSEWSQYMPLRVFRNEYKNCYAFMQRAPAPFYFWPGAVFATCFADGGLLLSDNNLDAAPNPDDEVIRQGLVTLNLADVEELHLATMAALNRAGRKPDSDLGMETLLQALERVIAPGIKKQNGRAGTQYLFVHGLIHLCASTPLISLLGVGHYSVPIVNLVLGLILGLGESSHKRQYARAVREAIRERNREAAKKTTDDQ
ncbi:MAG: hypothetical protein K8T89_14320 [Planctomycetes bacterium]|nr:hypothetical protein [Planctomycetota bacterium]